MRLSVGVLCCLGVLSTGDATASDATQFRGESGNAVAQQAAHPAVWGPEQNVAWTRDVPGRGWAAPLILGDAVYIATAVAEGADQQDRNAIHQWELHCYDLATGEPRWKKVAKRGVPSIGTHGDNTYASETPVTDGQNIYVYFGMTGLYAYSSQGEELWQKDLGSYPMRNDWGTSSSPAVYDGKIFVQVDNEGQSFIVALDTENGEQLWRKPRDERSNWSSVVIWQNRERSEVVTGGAKYRSYDPDTGEVLWELDAQSSRASATPAGNQEMLIIGAEDRSRRGGGRGGVFAVKAGASGQLAADDPESDGLLWANTDTPAGIASPLLYEGQVYLALRRGGVLHCFDAQTGKQNYRQRLQARAYWASPWAADGLVFVPGDRGRVAVLKPGPEFELVRYNQIDGRLWVYPAMADGSLILRYEDRLVCVRAEEDA